MRSAADPGTVGPRPGPECGPGPSRERCEVTARSGSASLGCTPSPPRQEPLKLHRTLPSRSDLRTPGPRSAGCLPKLATQDSTGRAGPRRCASSHRALVPVADSDLRPRGGRDTVSAHPSRATHKGKILPCFRTKSCRELRPIQGLLATRRPSRLVPRTACPAPGQPGPPGCGRRDGGGSVGAAQPGAGPRMTTAGETRTSCAMQLSQRRGPTARSESGPEPERRAGSQAACGFIYLRSSGFLSSTGCGASGAVTQRPQTASADTDSMPNTHIP